MKENARALHPHQRAGFRVIRNVTFRQPNDSHEMVLEFELRGARDDAAAPR